MLYNFVTHTEQSVDVTQLTDEQAVAFIPQHPVIQSLYTLMRAQGYPVIEALTEVLKIQLMSGGQRKLLQTREGGRG